MNMYEVENSTNDGYSVIWPPTDGSPVTVPICNMFWMPVALRIFSPPRNHNDYGASAAKLYSQRKIRVRGALPPRRDMLRNKSLDHQLQIRALPSIVP